MSGQTSVSDRLLQVALWGAVVVLTVIGVAAAIGRGVFLSNLSAAAGSAVFPEHRQEFEEMDRRFATRPVLTYLHIVPGALFLTFAPFQFSARLRARHLSLHRWCGRALVILALLAGLSAFPLGLPSYGGPVESSATILFGTLFLVAVGRAFVAIRRRDVARHREWMIRGFSIAIGISTIRIVTSILSIITPAMSVQELIALSFWIGWTLMVGVAELWVRRTRPRRVASGSTPALATGA